MARKGRAFLISSSCGLDWVEEARLVLLLLVPQSKVL